MNTTKLSILVGYLKVHLHKMWAFLTGPETAVQHFSEPFDLQRSCFVVSGLQFNWYQCDFLLHAHSSYPNYRHWFAGLRGCRVVLTEFRVGELAYQVAGRYARHAFMEKVVFSGAGPTEYDVARAVEIVCAKLLSLPELQELAPKLSTPVAAKDTEIQHNKEY